ncbi:DUF1707 domain-containing protein [Micromonospora sp. WMMD882]|uniref:DUF1707 domain-containing protein n=1 Tax=Micromonospora sp. WMMD882 TaxID=3015151 RepID=UPI00248C5B78|nr:DUF1707 domain-containing protein [Micromonospora sp. WMMD882]WBB78417.1 DUF1707 domain-containing protein [Micromonospora sp. WMMD882]
MTIDPGTRETPAVPGGAPRSTAGPDRRRVGRPERDRVIALLSEAVSADYLTFAEFEERSARAALARDRADLDALTHDLPPDLLHRIGRDERRARLTRAALLGVRVHVGVYLAASLFMVALWLIIAVSADAWYPWPIWPILGWGVGVLGHAVPVTLVARNRARNSLPG